MLLLLKQLTPKQCRPLKDVLLGLKTPILGAGQEDGTHAHGSDRSPQGWPQSWGTLVSP